MTSTNDAFSQLAQTLGLDSNGNNAATPPEYLPGQAPTPPPAIPAAAPPPGTPGATPTAPPAPGAPLAGTPPGYGAPAQQGPGQPDGSAMQQIVDQMRSIVDERKKLQQIIQQEAAPDSFQKYMPKPTAQQALQDTISNLGMLQSRSNVGNLKGWVGPGGEYVPIQVQRLQNALKFQAMRQQELHQADATYGENLGTLQGMLNQQRQLDQAQQLRQYQYDKMNEDKATKDNAVYQRGVDSNARLMLAMKGMGDWHPIGRLPMTPTQARAELAASGQQPYDVFGNPIPETDQPGAALTPVQDKLGHKGFIVGVNDDWLTSMKKDNKVDVKFDPINGRVLITPVTTTTETSKAPPTTAPPSVAPPAPPAPAAAGGGTSTVTPARQAGGRAGVAGVGATREQMLPPGADPSKPLPNPADEEMAKMVSTFDKDPMSARVAPEGALIMARAKVLNPSYNEAQYKAFTKTENAAAEGWIAKNKTALNTAIPHLKELLDASDALKSGNLQFVNSIANKLGVATGDNAATNFNLIARKVGQELTSAYVPGEGAQAERMAAAGDYMVNGSPDQIRGAIGKTLTLLNSRMDALQSTYNEGTYGHGKINLFDPATVQARNYLVDKLTPKVTVSYRDPNGALQIKTIPESYWQTFKSEHSGARRADMKQ